MSRDNYIEAGHRAATWIPIGAISGWLASAVLHTFPENNRNYFSIFHGALFGLVGYSFYLNKEMHWFGSGEYGKKMEYSVCYLFSSLLLSSLFYLSSNCTPAQFGPTLPFAALSTAINAVIIHTLRY